MLTYVPSYKTVFNSDACVSDYCFAYLNPQHSSFCRLWQSSVSHGFEIPSSATSQFAARPLCRWTHWHSVSCVPARWMGTECDKLWKTEYVVAEWKANASAFDMHAKPIQISAFGLLLTKHGFRPLHHWFGAMPTMPRSLKYVQHVVRPYAMYVSRAKWRKLFVTFV